MNTTSFKALALVLLAAVPLVTHAALSCSVTTAAACTSPSVILLRMSASSNAHAELPTQSTAAYANNVMCCSGVSGLDRSCTGTNGTVAKLSGATNAHVQQSSQVGYANNACLSVPAGGSVSIGYQAGNCTGYDTTLGSISAATNAQVGGSSAYNTKICGSAGDGASLSFVLSDSTIGFGALSANGTRHATGDQLGAASEIVAHTLVASTTSATGYTITVQGATLTSGQNTVNAIGGTNTASVASIEQFGLRMTASGGVGNVAAPYAASGFAYAATATTSSQVASATTGNGADTTYSVRYVANISPQTETGTYTASLVYTITAEF